VKELDLGRVARKISPVVAGSENTVRRRLGRICDVTGGSATVCLGDSDEEIEDVAFLASYSPTIDDIVWIDIKDGDLLIIGSVGPALYRPLKTFGTWTAWTAATTAQPGETVAEITVAAQGWQQYIDLYALFNAYVNAANGQVRVAWYSGGPGGTMLTPTRVNAKNLAAAGNEQLIVRNSTTLAANTAGTYTLQVWPTTVTSWTNFVDGNYNTAYAISQRA